MKTAKKNQSRLSAHVNLGLAFGEEGHYQEAADSLRKAIALEPEDAEIRFGLGVALFLSGDKVPALEQCLMLRGINRKLSDELYKRIKPYPKTQ